MELRRPPKKHELSFKTCCLEDLLKVPNALAFSYHFGQDSDFKGTDQG